MAESKRFRNVSALGLCVVLMAVAMVLVVPRLGAQAKGKDWIGSWSSQITVVTQNATFPGLLTFFDDGNLIADETPSPLETSGHGAWTRTGANEANYSFEFLIGNTEPGKWLRGKVNGILHYTPATDQWNGPFTIKVVDQSGLEVLSDTGTIVSTRILPYSR